MIPPTTLKLIELKANNDVKVRAIKQWCTLLDQIMTGRYDQLLQNVFASVMTGHDSQQKNNFRWYLVM